MMQPNDEFSSVIAIILIFAMMLIVIIVFALVFIEDAGGIWSYVSSGTDCKRAANGRGF